MLSSSTKCMNYLKEREKIKEVNREYQLKERESSYNENKNQSLYSKMKMGIITGA